MAGIGNHLMFLVIFLGLTSTYGLASSAALQGQFNSLTQTINAPLPPPPTLNLAINGTKASNCNFGDVSCTVNNFINALKQNVQAGVIGPLAIIGAAVVWFFQVLWAFITKMTAIGSIVPLLGFGAIDASSSVPFGLYFMLGVMFIVILEIFRVIRGSSASGV